MQIHPVSFGIALLCCGAPLLGQRVSSDAAPRDKSYVEATGTATISVKPDQAILGFGVVTQGLTAAAVGAQNAKQTDAALAELRKLLAPGDQLKTTGYSVRPNYQTPKPGATPTIAGYTATNTIEIKTGDLAQVGKLVDTVLQSGGNSIQTLDFGLKDTQAVRSQALRQAAIQAKANAQAIADGLGIHIVRVLSAEEPTGQPGVSFAMSRRGSVAPGPPPPTEVTPGTVDVSAEVVVRMEVSQ